MSKDRGVYGYDYRNYEACSSCQYKERCTRCQKGRSICRHVDQDFLDTIDLQTEINKDKYQLRQMIIEHVFGTKNEAGVRTTFWPGRSYRAEGRFLCPFWLINLKRAINILGPKEILKRLREKRESAMA
ncbi:transposase [Pelorhabdus rhamnosifermentans]|uniref:transposase n=1 Tax=Pelorhabdus rhamnosifermentans TaxID=2772457 RepID=UPI001C06252E